MQQTFFEIRIIDIDKMNRFRSSDIHLTWNSVIYGIGLSCTQCGMTNIQFPALIDTKDNTHKSHARCTPSQRLMILKWSLMQ